MTISSRAETGNLFTVEIDAGRVVGVFRGAGVSATRLGAATIQRLTAANRAAVDAVMSRALDVIGAA